MPTKRFLLLTGAALVLGGVLLVLGSVADSPVLAVAGAVSVLSVGALRERWQWDGAGRQWLVMMAVLGGVIIIAFVVERLS